MVRQQVLKGHNGRRRNGTLLMCRSCAARTQDDNKVIAVLAFIAVAMLCIIFAFAKGR
jgi:hypothetical protein